MVRYSNFGLSTLEVASTRAPSLVICPACWYDILFINSRRSAMKTGAYLLTRPATFDWQFEIVSENRNIISGLFDISQMIAA